MFKPKYLKNQARYEKAVTTFVSYFKSFSKLANDVSCRHYPLISCYSLTKTEMKEENGTLLLINCCIAKMPIIIFVQSGSAQDVFGTGVDNVVYRRIGVVIASPTGSKWERFDDNATHFTTGLNGQCKLVFAKIFFLNKT